MTYLTESKKNMADFTENLPIFREEIEIRENKSRNEESS
jgi:hypothetical protein